MAKAASPSPYTKTKAKQNPSRHTVAIPEDVMVLVDRWAVREESDGRPTRSRNDAVNRIVLNAVREFITISVNPNKKENGTK